MHVAADTTAGLCGGRQTCGAGVHAAVVVQMAAELAGLVVGSIDRRERTVMIRRGKRKTITPALKRKVDKATVRAAS